MVNTQLKLPCVGSNNFEVFFKDGGAYYVDKTAFLEEILKSKTTVYLFTRPRRFGKSLNLSMIESFLKTDYKAINCLVQRKKQDPNYANTDKFYDHIEVTSQTDIFSTLNIGKKQDFCFKYMGQYPVVSVSFREAFSLEDPASALKELQNVVVNLAKKLGFLANCEELDEVDKLTLGQLQKLNFIELSPTDRKSILKNSLQNLVSYLAKYCHREVYLLIDEYDVPLAKTATALKKLDESIAQYQNQNRLDKVFELTDWKEEYANFKEVYSTMLSKALKDNTIINKAIVCGCLRVVKESIFTGLNNFSAVDFNVPAFSSFFGFTHDEVKELLKYYDHDFDTLSKYDLCRYWYDGYKFADTEIFCPWDVISFVDGITKGVTEPKAYWIGTSGNELPRDLFNQNPKAYAQGFEDLLCGKAIEVNVEDNLNYQLIEKNENPNYFWTLLYSTGYLTLADESCENHEHKMLKIPNQCVKKCLENLLKWCFSTGNPKFQKSSSTILDDLYTGNSKRIEFALNELLNRFVSFMDYSNSPKESYYHGFLNGLFSQLSRDEQVINYSSNLELGEGRADICFVMLTKDPELPNKGILLELKVADSSNLLNETSQKAIDQITSKQYDQAFLSKFDILGEIKSYGIAFNGKTCIVKDKTLTR